MGCSSIELGELQMKFQSALLALASSLLLASPVLADAESDVIAACKPDVERLCKGVQPGGRQDHRMLEETRKANQRRLRSSREEGQGWLN